MIIENDTFIPYTFDDPHDVFKYIKERCNGLTKMLTRIEKDSEHLTVRCPLSGDYLEVLGTSSELDWLDNELRRKGLYKL